MKGRILTFTLCDAVFGIDITSVKEINRNVEYTLVPGAKEHIVGLMNLRGQVVTIVSLANILEYPAEAEKRTNNCIILKTTGNETNSISFLIDKPGDVIDIDDDVCEAPPANVGNVDGRLLSYIVKMQEQLIMVIDVEKVFNEAQ